MASPDIPDISNSDQTFRLPPGLLCPAYIPFHAFHLIQKWSEEVAHLKLNVDWYVKTKNVELHVEFWHLAKLTKHSISLHPILNSYKISFLCPHHSECYPCPCVRPTSIKSWCPLKFGMFIFNIKTQVEFDLGYNPLFFDGVMGLL